MNQEYISVNNYDIFINLDTDNLTYKGYVIINFEIKKNVNNLDIDAVGFNISNLKILGKSSTSINHINQYNYDNNRISLSGPFKPDNYICKINFNKKLNTEPYGFYYSITEDYSVYSTQLEPEDTRYFIPCFDAPYLKANFNLSVLYKNNKGLECYSNMDYLVKKKYGQNIFIKFKSTPKMSTYLLNLIIGNYISVLDKPLITKSGIQINCYCFKSDIDKIKWTIEHFVKAIETCEKYFDQVYVLPKLDYIIVPNLSSTATEYWGLIDFNRDYMTKSTNLDINLIDIIETIYHEVIHQWVGNMVTNKYWNEIWINESITSNLTWYFLTLNYKKLDINTFYYIDVYSDVMLNDCFNNVQPVRINKIYPNEIFTGTIYDKGNILINYFKNFIGKNTYNEILKNFVQEFKYSNVEAQDFINALALNQNSIDHKLFKKIISYNLDNNGFPLITISIQNNNIIIEKQKFSTDRRKIDYPVDILLSIKTTKNNVESIKKIFVNKDRYSIKLEKNEIFQYANTNNDLLCVIIYNEILKPYELMNDIELYKYLDDLYCLGVYGWIQLDKLNEKMLKVFDFLHNNLKINVISHLISLEYTLINLLVFINNGFKNNNFEKIKLIDKKCNCIVGLINKIEHHIEDMDDKSFEKYKLINIINKLKVVYLKDQEIIKKLYLKYKNNNYNNNILDSVLTNIVLNYPEETIDFYKIIIKNDNLDNMYIIRSLQYVDIKNFNIFVKKINLINFNNISRVFGSIVLNNKLVGQVVEFVCKNYMLFNDRLLYEIINGLTRSLYDKTSINKMVLVLEKIIQINNKNNFLLNMDYLKTNLDINSRFTFD
jgi:hypothetical protein